MLGRVSVQARSNIGDAHTRVYSLSVWDGCDHEWCLVIDNIGVLQV